MDHKQIIDLADKISLVCINFMVFILIYYSFVTENYLVTVLCLLAFLINYHLYNLRKGIHVVGVVLGDINKTIQSIEENKG